MSYYQFVVLLSLASRAFALGPTHFNCGTLSPTEDLLSAHEELRKTQDLSRAKAQGVSVNTYFHVISPTANAPITSDNTLQQQLRVMNQLFAPQAIAFNLVSTSYTVNQTWANDDDDTTMKRALHRGSYRDLNLYFQPSLHSNAIGRCTLPGSGGSTAPANSPIVIQDGCNIDINTLPGGAYSDYNQGKTVVHEVGHWFGLLHTFQGGCDGDGDFVSDTAAEMTPTDGCPTNKDTCPGGGPDPVNNYMDYSSDPCYTQFTQGQGTRMQGMFAMYRNRARQ